MTTTKLHYTTLHDTTLITLHHTTTTTTLHYTTLQCTTIHYTNDTKLQQLLLLQLHYITLNYTYYTLQLQLRYTLQLQLQLHYTTLHSAVVGEVATATIATNPKNTTSTTFRSISGFALPSVIHNNQPVTSLSYRFPIFETSATALRGTIVVQERMQLLDFRFRSLVSRT